MLACFVEIPQGLDPPLVDDGEAVHVRHGLSRPLEVWGQNESKLWVRVLEDNSLHLFLVLEDVVYPLEGELLGLDVRQDESLIQLWSLLYKVTRTAEILLNVFLSRRVDQV